MFLEEVTKMPRMSKQTKAEMEMFLGEKGRIKYNAKCRACAHSCKQSYKADLVWCPIYERKVKK